MGTETAISWTDHTANFWMGCAKVSPGCAKCYAETLTTNRMGLKVWGHDSGRQATKGIWADVRKWNRAAEKSGQRARVFVMSLGDFFEDHPTANAVRPRAWEAMREAPWLDFQILTKRPENFGFLPSGWGPGWPNVWLGVSVEDQKRADERIPILLRTLATVKFLSCEPLLGPIVLPLCGHPSCGCPEMPSPPGTFDPTCPKSIDTLMVTGNFWVIAGGESGPGFRPMNHDWARSLRDQCREARVPFFFKQSSGPRPGMGIELDGEVIQEFPHV
jgi:protein gp37